MASIPMDQSGSRRSGGKSADRLPVSAHPAFPAIVALWFAALLGLGSLILPVQLIERLLTATGIAWLIPGATPPLGFTARAAIALAATVGGALLGLFAARKVTQAAARSPSEERTQRNHAISDNFDADFDEDGLDADLPPLREIPAPAQVTLGRRRSLAMDEEARPSDFLNVVPLPGDYADEEEDEDEDEDDALELGQEYAPVQGESEDVRYDETDQVAEAEGEESPVEFTRSQPAALTLGEPLPFSPPSLARFTGYAPETVLAPAIAEDAAEAVASDQDIHSEETPAFEATPENDVEIVGHEQIYIPATQPVSSSADGEVTGLVQLVQKLNHTLEKHREWTAQRALSAATESMVVAVGAADALALSEQPHNEFAEEFEPAPADDAAEAMAAWFGKSPAVAEEQPLAEAEPAPSSAPVAGYGYTPFSGMGRLSVIDGAHADEDEDDDIEELAASFRLPVSTPVQPAPTQLRDASYGSLSTDNPFRRPAEEFVRIDEPDAELGFARPAVVFPSEEAARPVAPSPVANTRAFDRPFDPPGTAPAPAANPISGPIAQLHSEAQSAPLAPRPASNDDSERALREALMNLQRMGK